MTEEVDTTPEEFKESRFPGLGVVEAECENGHVSKVPNREFPYRGRCSRCQRQVEWRQKDD